MKNRQGFYCYAGPWLAGKLKERNITHGEMAKMLDLHFQGVSNIVRGMCKIPPKHMRKIAKILAVDEVNEFDLLERMISLTLKDEEKRIRNALMVDNPGPVD